MVKLCQNTQMALPPVFYTRVASPVGALLLASNGQALTDLHILSGQYVPAIASHWQASGDDAVLQQARQELTEYFAGQRQVFTLALAAQGTVFQQMAWQTLLRIPFGQTQSYGQQAAWMGKPKAVRAVGGANGKNPIAIVIPCHRVVGADGSLTGYSGGMAHKKFLLRHEGAWHEESSKN